MAALVWRVGAHGESVLKPHLGFELLDFELCGGSSGPRGGGQAQRFAGIRSLIQLLSEQGRVGEDASQAVRSIGIIIDGNMKNRLQKAMRRTNDYSNGNRKKTRTSPTNYTRYRFGLSVTL